MGFDDKTIAKYWNVKEIEVYNFKKEHGITPVYKMVDTCAGEFDAETPYFYSCTNGENEAEQFIKELHSGVLGGGSHLGEGVAENCAAGCSEGETSPAYQFDPIFHGMTSAKTDAKNSKGTIVVLGSGPIRIGQGIEFDYSSVQCIKK